MCLQITLITRCKTADCGEVLNEQGRIRVCDTALKTGEFGSCHRGVEYMRVPQTTTLICDECLMANRGVNPYNPNQQVVVGEIYVKV